MTPPAIDLTVLVISHGHDALLGPCLAALEPGLVGLNAEVLVVDNLGSVDSGGLAAGLPRRPRLLANRTPVSLAANANQGARVAGGRYLLLLNPDTVLRAGRFTEAIAFLEATPDAGVLGCKLVNCDGTLQPSYRRFPTVPVVIARGLAADRWPWRPAFYRRRLMRTARLVRATAVDWVYGACLLLRRDLFLAMGGMDERFRLYYEDVDLCYRLRQRGLRTYYFPPIEVEHHHARQSACQPLGAHWRWHVRSVWWFFRKHGYVLRPLVAVEE